MITDECVRYNTVNRANGMDAALRAPVIESCVVGSIALLRMNAAERTHPLLPRLSSIHRLPVHLLLHSFISPQSGSKKQNRNRTYLNLTKQNKNNYSNSLSLQFVHIQNTLLYIALNKLNKRNMTTNSIKTDQVS